MSIDQPQEKWKIEVNDRYQKVIGSVVALATASLVLPALFLREFLGVPKETALMPLLNPRVYLSWGLLFTSVILGIVFYYLSAKWVKSAWGQPVALSASIERLLDISFGLSVACFVMGIGALLWFIAPFLHAS